MGMASLFRRLRTAGLLADQGALDALEQGIGEEADERGPEDRVTDRLTDPLTF
jgi:hypothetical protein